MDRYKSHVAHTDEYGSRCEYCLQNWPCDAVEQATLARAAVRALQISADYRHMTLMEWCQKYGVWGITAIRELRDGSIDSVLDTDTARAWLADG